MDQVGFRRGIGIDHALAVFETVCGKSVEWNVEIWFASLDLTKAFDRVEFLLLLCARPSQSETQRLRSHRDMGKIRTERSTKCETKCCRAFCHDGSLAAVSHT